MTTSSSRAKHDAAQFWQAHARKRLSSASSSHGSVAWNAFEVCIRPPFLFVRISCEPTRARAARASPATCEPARLCQRPSLSGNTSEE
eukprot:3233540-Pyramimonas_sp.AAC.1